MFKSFVHIRRARNEKEEVRIGEVLLLFWGLLK